MRDEGERQVRTQHRMHKIFHIAGKPIIKSGDNLHWQATGISHKTVFGNSRKAERSEPLEEVEDAPMALLYTNDPRAIALLLAGSYSLIEVLGKANIYSRIAQRTVNL